MTKKYLSFFTSEFMLQIVWFKFSYNLPQPTAFRVITTAMCAPGSKYAQNLNALFTVQFLIAFYMKQWYGFMHPFIVEQSTISANTWFSELPSAESAQGKWVLSEEVRDEISACLLYTSPSPRD